MKTIRIQNEQDIQQTEKTVLVLGYFDGLHQGHKQLFQEARKIAARQGLKIAVLTFPESPQLTFVHYQPDLLLHLANPEERRQQLENLGVDILYLLDFTSRFASLSAQDFFETYVQKIKAQALVAGFDYHFGSDSKSAQDLADYFKGEIVIVPPVMMDGEKISSTRIRKTIQSGDIAKANCLLGHSFSTRGIVVHGNARGRTIGYPTANLAPIDRVFLPAEGVYVVNVEYAGQLYRGMASVGRNITFGETELRLEVNLFDFSQDIYGETLRVFWLDKIREMTKFSGIDALMKQLQEDEARARSWQDKV